MKIKLDAIKNKDHNNKLEGLKMNIIKWNRGSKPYMFTRNR